MAYWSAADDYPPTYHTCTNCPSGRRILPENLRKGIPPSGREKCGICKDYEKAGVCVRRRLL